MIRCFLFLIILVFTNTLLAQRQYPNLQVNLDSLINNCYDATTIAEKEKAVSDLGTAVQQYEQEYPLFRGVMYIYQGYWHPVEMQQKNFISKGLTLIKEHKQFLTDSFSYEIKELLGNFSWSKRMKEWLPVDSIIRSVVSTQTDHRDFWLLAYADKKMRDKHYIISKNIALYDIHFSQTMHPNTSDYMLGRVYSEWTAINSSYLEWKAVPYYNRNEKFSLKKSFKDLIRNLEDLRDSLVKANPFGSKAFKQYQRFQFYRIYKEAVLAYAGWSISDHREGQAIITLKNFLLNDLIPNEMNAAAKAGVKPVISCSEVSDLFAKLAELYLNIGNGKSADDIARTGIDFIDKYKSCTDDEVNRGLSFLFYMRTKANRTEGKYEASLRKNDVLKKWYPQPKAVDKSSLNQWNWFIEARMQEVYTLMAQKKVEQAVDSLDLLMKLITPLDSADLLYQSYQWPHLQYLTMKYMARKGKWEPVRNFTLSALEVLEQENHWEEVPYYYDLQLLYFIAKYRSEQKILKHIVANMLFYTGRHLQHTFFMLTPEDRIKLYEEKLSVYFDVYHELLVNKLIEDEPSLKERIIGQSLFLKNALVDANLIPNEFIAKGDEWTSLIEDIRQSRSNQNLILSRWRMRKQEDIDIDTDDAQGLWIRLLENANLDSLSRFTGWKKIALSLKNNQAYVETIRYTNWLSDSSSTYAAYIIKDGAMDVKRLFNETEIVKLLKDPSSSPQSGSLNATNTRGLTLTKKDVAEKKFKPGSEDKLGTLVLSPLWNYISNKQELLIVPDGLLSRISLAALQYQGKSLFSTIKLRQLSGSYVLHQKPAIFPSNGTAMLAGGLNYKEYKGELNINRLLNKKYTWQYLPATKKEVESLQAIFKNAGEQVTMFTGDAFPDSLRSELSKYNIIHLATHGFYIDSSAAKEFYERFWDKEAIRNNPMMRCGIATSAANNPDSNSITTDGHLLGYELANTDLRKCYIASLSACETGLGDLRNNLGVDGLPRALKLGGARYLLISLWKVPDEPTAVFMQQFYKELFRLKDPVAALQSTQTFMSKKYGIADWAAFMLVE